MQTLSKILKIIDKTSENTAKAFSYLILLIVFFESLEVVRRYILNNPTDWSWELCTLISGSIVAVGSAWVLKDNGHVRTDIIYGSLSRRGKAIVDCVLFVIIFCSFAGVLTTKIITNMIYSWKIHETTATMWGPPLYPLKTAFALGFILISLQGIAKFIRDIYYLVKGEEL